LIDFENFHTLDPEAVNTARALVNGERGESGFEPFMMTWMGFNGWMEAITGDDRDRHMINALADNRRATDAYDNLLQGSAEFHRQVRALSRLFPVLDLRDTRKKLGRDAFARLPGPALILACQRASVKQVPDGWVEGDTPTWPQVLRTIYQIRCNLFHGGKSPHNRRDRDLVRRAQAVLTTFIDGSECFDWR